MTLEIQDVTKRVGAEIHIHETSLRFLPGHFNVLLGETNAGKTTLMKLMAGLDQPTSGYVLIDGVDVTKHRPKAVKLVCSSIFRELSSPQCV